MVQAEKNNNGGSGVYLKTNNCETKEINYVWTEKAEKRAKKLKLDERKEGQQAYYGFDKLIDRLVDGGMDGDPVIPIWLEMGYIREANNG